MFNNSSWLGDNTNQQVDQVVENMFVCQESIQQFIQSSKMNLSSIQQSCHTLMLSRSSQVELSDEMVFKTDIDISQSNTQVEKYNDLGVMSATVDSILYEIRPHIRVSVGEISKNMGFLQFNEQMHECRVDSSDKSEVTFVESLTTHETPKNV